MGRVARQSGGHADTFGVDRELNERPAFEIEDWFAGVTVTPVLTHRVIHGLSRERVLEFHRSDGDAVQTDRQVEGLLRFGRIMKLAGETEPVGGVAGFEFWIQLMSGLEKCGIQRASVALEPMAQRSERSVRVHPLAKVIDNLVTGSIAVKRLQPGPVSGLRVANERQHRVRKDRAFPIETISDDGDVPVRQKMSFDDSLEGGFGGLDQVFTPYNRGNPRSMSTSVSTMVVRRTEAHEHERASTFRTGEFSIARVGLPTRKKPCRANQRWS